MDSIEVLQELASQVRSAKQEGENTAERVGRLLEGIVERLGGGYFTLQTDANGMTYLHTEYSLAVMGGLTTFARSSAVVPSIFEGIPIDNDTIYWDESTGVRILKAKGSGGGSDFDATAMWTALSAATDEQINKSHLATALSGYATTTELSNKWTQDNDKITSWDNAASKAHEHANKATLDKIYEKDGVIYWDGSLAVTGGITAYALGNVEVSTIMDGVVVDGTTIKKENGKLVVIGGSGSSFDEDAMWTALSSTTNEQINKSHLTTALSEYAIKSELNTSNWDAAYSWGNHAAAGYAKQTALDDVSTKLNDFLEGSDTDTIINKWKELEAFLAGMSETDNLAEILSTKADKSYVDTELTKYVTLATEQTIDGLKHFTNGLTIGATKHKIYEKDGNILIEGNVLVTGGITAYSDGSGSGGSGGGGIDVEVLWEILGGTGTQQINVSHLTTALTWNNISSKPSWIGDTKPSYVWSEIGNKPTTLGGYGITDAYTKTDSDNRFVNISGDTMTGDLTIQRLTISHNNEINSTDYVYLGYRDTINGVNVCFNNTPFTYGSSRYIVWHAGNDGHGSGLDADLLDGYHEEMFFRKNRFSTSDTNDTRLFSLNGSAVDTSSIGWNGSFFGLNCNSSNSGLVFSLLGFGGDLTEGKIKVNYSVDNNRWGSEWRTLAFTEGNVYSATKLQTARTIWGQSFDGTGNVDGTLRIQATGGNFDEGIRIKPTNNWTTILLGGRDLTSDTGTSGNSWSIHNNNGFFWINRNSSNGHTGYELCNVGGNWGIGTTSPTAKLDVNGSIYSNSECHFSVGTYSDPVTGVNCAIKVSNNFAVGSNCYLATKSGNVGIGTTSPSYKLEVNGDIHAYSWLRTTGNCGWYSQTYDGGWYMADSTWIRTYNNKSVYSGNGVFLTGAGSQYAYSVANLAEVGNCRFGSENLGRMSANHVRPIFGWQDTVSNGWTTSYIMGTYRPALSNWGRIYWGVFQYETSKAQRAYMELRGDTNTLYVAGNILSSGGITCYASDQRAKTVIEDIDLSLEQIANAPTIRFKWNDWKIKDDGKTHIGGIAQYMQKLLPETVLEADGMLNLDYSTTGYIFAVQTAKHLVKTDTEVERLKKRVKKLEKQLKQLGYEEANIMDDKDI